MKVTIAGKELKIYWRYPANDRETVCYIESLDTTIFCRGEATLGKHDQFCKEIGRRISLGRALKYMRVPTKDTQSSGGVIEPVMRSLSKAERHKVLEAYHGRKNNT